MTATAIAPFFRFDGSLVDLAGVRPEDISFAEMAATLSRIARWTGHHTEACAFSVAQHSVMGADAIFAESEDHILAGCFLLHDGHEYLIGDQSRPVARLTGHYLARLFRFHGFAEDVSAFAEEVTGEAIAAMKADIDRAIYAAAGIGYPHLYPEYARRVRQMDERMIRAEGIALYGRRAGAHLPAARLPAPKLRTPIEPWPAMKAEMAFIDRLETYLRIAVRPS